MRIQHNIMAMSAYRNYTNNVSAMKKNLEKLSSGYKINRAGDDAAGLAISEKMRAQITGLETAQKNAKDGISLVQTAEGALTEVHDMLNRMVELATQSANGTYDNDTDRYQLQKEMDQLRSEINRIADSSNFNGIKLLDGSMSSSGGVSTSTKFSLPGVGTVLGTDTVLNRDAAGQTSGTSFSVDLHNRQIRNGDGDTFEIDTGDIKIVLTGTASGSAVGPVSANAIIGAITGGATAAASAGFTVEIFLNGASTAVAASAITSAGSQGGIKFTLGDKGEITVKRGTNGDDRLTFEQVNRPTSKDQIWDPANAVQIKFTAAAGSTQSLSLDDAFLVGPETLSANPLVTNQPTLSFASSAITIKAAGSTLAATGTTAAAAATKAFGVEGLKLTAGNLTVTGSKALAAAGTSSGDVTVKIVGSVGNEKYGLFVGTKQIASAAIASIASGSTATIAFGTIGSIKLTAGTGGVDVSAIKAGTGTISTNMSIGPATPAVTAAVSGSTSNLLAALDPLTGSNVDIKLQYASAGSQWTITAGASKTINVTASLSGSKVLTVKSSSGATLMTLTLSATSGATIGEIQNVFKTAQTVATYGVQNPGGDKPDISAATSVRDVISILDAAASGSDAYFKSVGSVVPSVATLSASIAPTIAAIGSLANTGSAIGTATANALKGMRITVDGVAATIATSAVTASTTASMALKAIVNALNAAALAKAKSDLASLGSAVTSITVYSNFRFVDGTQVVAQSAYNDLKLMYDTKTYSTEESGPDQSSGDPGFPNWDHNVSTTAIDRVGLDGGDRLASTHFKLEQDKVMDGAKVQIGKSEYEFTTDDKYQVANDAAAAGKVYIGDLVDANGNLKDAAAMNTAMERLTWTAKDNGTYTVGFDKGRITVTEIEGQTDYAENGKSTLTTMDAIADSLGFTAAVAKAGKGLTLQIGDTADSYNQLTVEIKDMHTAAMGIADISISDQDSAAKAVDAIKNAINYVSDVRGTLGATQNRLDHTINNLSVMTENIQDAESTIRDTDVADEMMAYTKNNILIQSAQAMLAQANQVPQGVLQLLQ